MQAFFFYLFYPFIYLLASMPLSILYRVSDFLFHILWLSGYRKKVVLKNLSKSFPNKTHEEIENYCKRYYRYLCDLILETLKTITMTEQEYKERLVFKNTAWLDKMYEEKQSFIIVMGHYGNWEWTGPIFTLTTKFQLVVVYRPLTNIYFENMLAKARTKFGTMITPVNKTLRDMVANRNKITATALVADQAASRENAYWTTFLNQETNVFNGPEKLSKKFNYPVVYIKTTLVKRGYYEVTPELLFDDPKNTTDGEIVEVFTRRLEKDIIENPIPWLWSHKRWKHKRVQS